MEYTKQIDLYRAVIPAFNVKHRLTLYSKKEITNKDIWLYLANNKWKNSQNLTISEVVNDIITVDIDKLYNYKEEQ